MAESVVEVVIKVRNELQETLQQLQKQVSTLQNTFKTTKLPDDTTAKVRGLKNETAEASKEATNLFTAFQQADVGVRRLVGGVRFLIAGFLGLKAIRMAENLANTAGRAEVLGTVLNVVGSNAGISTQKLKEMEEGVKKLGITTAAARQALTILIQSNLVNEQSAAKAEQLARAAQDLAVITGQNSSETFQRLIINIQQLDIVGLRWMGIMVDRAKGERDYAKLLGKSVEQMTLQERRASFMAAVLTEAAKLSGTYEASMTSVSKQIQSLKRYEEELARSLGNNLLPAQLALVEVYGELLSDLTKVSGRFGEASDAATLFGEQVRGIAESVADTIRWLVEHRNLVLTIMGAWATFKAAAIFRGWVIALSGVNASLGVMVGLQTTSHNLWVAMTAAGTAFGTRTAAAMALIRLAAGPLLLAVGALYVLWQLATKAAEDYAKQQEQGKPETQREILRETEKKVENIKKLQQDMITLREKENLLLIKSQQGDAGAEVDLKKVQDEIKDTQVVIDAAEKDWKAWVKDLTNPDLKSQVIDIRVNWDTRDKDLRAKLQQAQEAIDKARDELGLTKFNFEYGITLSNEFTGNIGRAELLINEFVNRTQAKLTTGFKTTNIEGGFRAITKAVEGTLASAKTPVELAKALEFLDKTAKDTGIEFRELREETQQRFEKANIEAFNQTIEVTKNNLTALRQTYQLQTDMAGQAGIEVNKFRQVLIDLGAPADNIRSGMADLYRTFSSFSNLKTEKTRSILRVNELELEVDKAKRAYRLDEQNRRQYYDERLREILNSSTQESVVTARIKQLDELNLKERLAATKEYYDKLKKLQADALSDFQKYANVVKNLDKEIFDTRARMTLTLREMRRQEMTEEQRVADIRTEMVELESEARSRALNGEYELAKQLANRRIELAQSLANSEDANVRTEAYEETKEAFTDLLTIQEQERFAAAENAQRLLNTYQEITNSVNKLAEVVQSIATEQIATLEVKLDQNSLNRAVDAIKNSFSNLQIKVRVAAEAAGAFAAGGLVRAAAPLVRFATGGSVRAGGGSGGSSSGDSYITNLVRPIAQFATGGAINLLTAPAKVYNSVVNTAQTIRENPQVRAAGGLFVGPGTGTSDSILALVSNEEFIHKAAAVKYYGADFMYALNDMRIPKRDLPKFAEGGSIKAVAASAATATGSSTRDVVDVNFNIGSEKVSLMGERNQVRKLVSSLKGLEITK